MTIVTTKPLPRRLTRGAALVLSLVGLGTTLACSSGMRSAPAGRTAGGTPAQLGEAVNAERLKQAPSDVAPTPLQVAQQLIRRGEMEMEVDDVSRAARRVERLATAMGGIIAFSNDDGEDDARVAIRIPSDRLDATMDSVAQFGHVERRATNSQDVTEHLLDMDARIATLAATRDRLRTLLARAEAIRDVIEVERELQRVQGELESLERRVTALRGQVAMSDLSVTLERRIVLGPIGQLFRGIGVAIGKLFVWR